MALIIAGERSGVGKTTVTLAMLSYLCDRPAPPISNSKGALSHPFGAMDPNSKIPAVQSFKVGPDYIDPMFHQYVTQRPCRNLDPILTTEDYVQQCFVHHCQGADYAVVEGVMGLFDGASGATDVASTAHIARLLDIPVLLVMDCSRLSRSVAAIIHGYQSFDPRIQLAGIVLNRVGSDRHLHLLKTAIEPLNVPILGILRRETDIAIPDRHLGLIPTDELPTLDAVVEQLKAIATTSFHWESLLPLLKAPRNSGQTGKIGDTQETSLSRPSVPCLHSPPLRIAIARDRAFNFYYADNLDLLAQLGATLVFWSPLQDEALPDDIHGLYLGGGFPEVFGAELSANRSALVSVKQAIEQGLPTYAECGGLMYLCDAIVDFEGRTHSMVGTLPATVRMGKKLLLGYRKAIAQASSSLMHRGQTVWGHEFHRSQLDTVPNVPMYHIQGYETPIMPDTEGWRYLNVHASYIHLHWGTQVELPTRFLHHCRTQRSLDRDRSKVDTHCTGK
ncbi:MAG: cobyrinate a,c-diamide synthase [Merismopedia sp. SIO2A8]|nr:cobyrinate a,c-diamide synthase [Merismopedia sp. SIO2A8]